MDLHQNKSGKPDSSEDDVSWYFDQLVADESLPSASDMNIPLPLHSQPLSDITESVSVEEGDDDDEFEGCFDGLLTTTGSQKPRASEVSADISIQWINKALQSVTFQPFLNSSSLAPKKVLSRHVLNLNNSDASITASKNSVISADVTKSSRPMERVNFDSVPTLADTQPIQLSSPHRGLTQSRRFPQKTTVTNLHSLIDGVSRGDEIVSRLLKSSADLLRKVGDSLTPECLDRIQTITRPGPYSQLSRVCKGRIITCDSENLALVNHRKIFKTLVSSRIYSLPIPIIYVIVLVVLLYFY